MKREDIIKEECKAELELYDIEYEGAVGLEDALELVGKIKAEMFDKGVKYTNRWREVSEELPDKSCEVLVKDSMANMYIAYFSYGKFQLDRYVQINGDVIEWKSID